MSKQPTVADYIVRRLAREGITDCFGVAGDFAFKLCDAVARSEAIRWIGCSNELDAAYAADGYARVRGCSMLLTTYAVGELSALNGVMGAKAERSCVFHLVGILLRRRPAEEPGLRPDRQHAPLRPADGTAASGTIYHGGRHDRADRFIAPTVLVNVSPDSPVMQEEIFGPILPVLEVDNVQQVIDFVNARPSPLGLYVFAEDQHVAEQILNSTTSGTRRSTTARSSRSFPTCPSAASATPGWASTTASGASAPTRTPAASCTTARRSTPTSATRRTAVRRHCVNWSLRNRVPTRCQGQEPNSCPTPDSDS